jgi:predicted DNA-binding transcriptional regulator AlpA
MVTATQNKPNKQYLRKKELTARYGVVARTIDRWTLDGRLPKPVHIGTVPMWDVNEVEACERAAMRARDDD